MTEYLTEAIILDVEPYGESDKKVHCYTKELGRISAKAKSARKITSKLSAHLEPLLISQMRIVEKSGRFQIVDAITQKKIHRSLRALTFIHAVKALTPELQKDSALWGVITHAIPQLAHHKSSYRPLLESLGFAIEFAACAACEKSAVHAFSKKELVFLCKSCSAKTPSSYETFPDLIEV